ncbi:MAG: acyltransferase family protein [Saprospiraceae bacterium]
MKPISYFPDFDALRAIAAILVVLFHVNVWLDLPSNTFYEYLGIILSFNRQGGEIGVHFFFVLSGFLITYLMFREQETTGEFSIRGFYWRRICRIWPLYFATVLIGFVIYPYLTVVLNRPYLETANFWYYLFFLANVNSYTNGFSLGILGVQWSVAIEEQFYLIWPLIFVLFNRKQFVYAVGLLLFIANLFIVNNLQHNNYIYFHSLSAVNELAIGGLVAYFAFYKPIKLKIILSKVSQRITGLVYTLGFIFLFFNKEMIEWLPFLAYIRKPLMALFFVFILIEQSYSSNSVVKFRQFKGLSFLGKISYGVYLLHMVAIQIVLGVVSYIYVPIAIQILAVFVLTFLLSYLSYRFFESPFLKLKGSQRLN